MKFLKYYPALVIVSCLASAQPKISIDNLEYKMGVVYSGMKVKGKIVLRNIGNDTLRIFSVQASCGCTTVRKPNDYILPKDSDEIEGEFNSMNYHGLTRKYLSITSNDPTFQNISVQLIIDVRDELRLLNPASQIWLGEPVVGKDTTETISFINVSDHKIRIKGVRTNSSFLSSQVRKTVLNPNDTLNVLVTINAKVPGYYRDDVVTLETDSKNLPDVPTGVVYRVIEDRKK
jgi:hypothetical protein